MRTSRMLVCVGLWMALCVQVCRAEQSVWSIGAFDRNYSELALARNYSKYPATFPKDIDYVVGKGQPDKDWSYIHPGPADSWAGGREHPFQIRFALPEEPQGFYKLRIALVDVQGAVPTGLRIQLNDAVGLLRLANGKGDASLTIPAAGKPVELKLILNAATLKKGDNLLTLTSTGSWILYDALSLSRVGSEETSGSIQVSAQPTGLLSKKNGELRQVVRVSIRNIHLASEGTLKVKAGAETLQFPVATSRQLGDAMQEVGVAPVPSPTRVDVELTTPAGSYRTETMLAPSRQWKIYIAASAHTDIGYTDLQPRVVERHDQNTDLAIDLCRKFPDFKWNCETSWQAENYLKDRPPARRNEFLELARQGRIGVLSSYLNMLTGLCSHEELNRWLYYAARLKREYGIPFESALSSDVPTQVWSLPSTLRAAGIRYFATGINTDRACTFTHLQSEATFSQGQHLFWWEGPDGARVLTYFSPGYGHASQLLSPDPEGAIMGLIRRHEALPAYPYDAIYLYGAFSDNCPLDARLAEVVHAWNQRYEYPKVILSTNAEFFRYIEGRFADKVPVIRGCGGTYWEDGAASSAQETTLNRRMHETASAADALAGVCGILDAQPVAKDAFYELWRNILLYDEHTWGSWASISDPKGAQTLGQWKIKAAFAYDAEKQAKALLDGGMARLAGLVSTTADSLFIFNPTAWTRTDALELTLPEGKVPLDPDTQKALPCMAGPKGATILIRDVPAWGYKCFPLAAGNPAAVQNPEEISAGEPVLENAFYKAVFDRRTGGIRSLVDKADGREMVDAKAPYTLNSYIYVQGGNGTKMIQRQYATPRLRVAVGSATKFLRRSLPGLGQEVVITGSGDFAPKIETTVTLWNHAKRVDIVNRLTRKLNYDKEAVYFAFPFNAAEPEVRIEIPNGQLRADVDMLPGACRDWFTAQHWVSVKNRAGVIAWTSPDAPLLCLEDIFRGLWREKLDLRTGHVYSYAMNNYWHTNYKAGQDGDFEFRYAITTASAAAPAEIARFGWQAAMPLFPIVVPAGQKGRLAGAGGICQVEPGHVFVTAIKSPETGDGLIVRLWEVGGQSATARLKLPMLGDVRSAKLCNLIEEPEKDLDVREGTIEVPVQANGLATVRVLVGGPKM